MTRAPEQLRRIAEMRAGSRRGPRYLVDLGVYMLGSISSEYPQRLTLGVEECVRSRGAHQDLSGFGFAGLGFGGRSSARSARERRIGLSRCSRTPLGRRARPLLRAGERRHRPCPSRLALPLPMRSGGPPCTSPRFASSRRRAARCWGAGRISAAQASRRTWRRLALASAIQSCGHVGTPPRGRYQDSAKDRNKSGNRSQRGARKVAWGCWGSSAGLPALS